MELSLLNISTTLECELNIYMNVAIVRVTQVILHCVFESVCKCNVHWKKYVEVKTPPEKKNQITWFKCNDIFSHSKAIKTAARHYFFPQILLGI